MKDPTDLVRNVNSSVLVGGTPVVALSTVARLRRVGDNGVEEQSKEVGN